MVKGRVPVCFTSNSIVFCLIFLLIPTCSFAQSFSPTFAQPSAPSQSNIATTFVPTSEPPSCSAISNVVTGRTQYSSPTSTRLSPAFEEISALVASSRHRLIRNNQNGDSRLFPVLWSHQDEDGFYSGGQYRFLVYGLDSSPGQRDAIAVTLNLLLGQDPSGVPSDPESITIDPDHNLYVVDGGDNPSGNNVRVGFERDSDTGQCRATGVLSASTCSLGNNCLIVEKMANREGGKILRFPEPATLTVMEPSGTGSSPMIDVSNITTIHFRYPGSSTACGGRPCGELWELGAAGSLSHNIEASFARVEPDGSTSLYLVSKATDPLEEILEGLALRSGGTIEPCAFESDGRTEVFRIRNINTLSGAGTFSSPIMAEHVTTLDFSETLPGSNDREAWRVVAADFLPDRYIKSQGVLALKTKTSALFWSVNPGSTIADALSRNPTSHRLPSLSQEPDGEAIALGYEGWHYTLGEEKSGVTPRIYSIHTEYGIKNGDANTDGSVNISDPIYFLNGLFKGGPQPFCRTSADADGDGQTNLTDALAMLYGTGVLPSGSCVRAPSMNETGQNGIGCNYYRPGASF